MSVNLSLRETGEIFLVYLTTMFLLYVLYNAERDWKGPRYPGGWVVLQNRSERSEEKKYPYPCRESNPGRPARSLLTILTKLSCSVNTN
jgi:hypothetical protein